MSALITIVCLSIGVYWFRSACVLLLRQDRPDDYELRVTNANQLNLPKVLDQLSSEEWPSHLDQMRSLLQSDYRMVMYLTRNAASYRTADYELSLWMLRFDFRLMQIVYRLMRRFSDLAAHFAVAEMAQVIGHLASLMGRRAARATAWD